ncbi:ABC-type branched-chain amino acid transport system, substrate-binding protein [Jiangella alba]|uniref:ABC-type branched-chain amino acid transport system, substrate-binding protein n=1 Tax=Jiangella alba TaxID=561176 RepID=A0A1H5PD94_9ACTN|nr:ABC-type branched-chain amino acid transport system, substrate-binding protein [Jiangella alba]
MRSDGLRACALALGCLIVAGGCSGVVRSTDDDPAAAPTSSGPGVAESFDSRFTGTEAFCTADTGDHQPEEVEPGITADSVVLTNVRLRLEDLVEVGFAEDVGDTADQVETFVRIVNEECGGINGRLIELNTVEIAVPGFGATDPQVEAQQACTSIAKDQHALGAFSFTGVGNPLAGCLTGPNDVIYVTTYDLSAQDFAAADGMLYSVNHSPADILTYAARELAGELEGRPIGVVYTDTEPNPQVVQEGLVAELERLGLEVARVDAIGCDAGNCTDGLIESVQGMRADGVEVVFPLLDTITMPTYLGEMVTQGFQPGDVEFVNTSFQAQDSELVTGKIVQFAGEAAAALYDGATIVSGSRAGEHRLDDFVPDPFVEMCNRVYAEYSDVIDAPYDLLDDADNLRASNVASSCSGVRLFARAIEAAGENPTRQDVAAVLAGFGDFDHGESLPASFGPGKPTGPDAIVVERFHYPCPAEFGSDSAHCIVPETDFLPLPADD